MNEQDEKASELSNSNEEIEVSVEAKAVRRQLLDVAEYSRKALPPISLNPYDQFVVCSTRTPLLGLNSKK